MNSNNEMYAIKGLDDKHFFALAHLVSDIASLIPFMESNKLRMDFESRFDPKDYPYLLSVDTINFRREFEKIRNLSLQILTKLNCIIDCQHASDTGWIHKIDLVLNVEKFIDLFKIVSKEYKKRLKANIAEEKTNNKSVFHFYKGVLHRDGINEVIDFGEKSLEHNLLAVTFENPLGSRIDCATPGIDTNDFRSLYDAAKRVNDKISQMFEVKDFFSTEWKNQYITRQIE